MEFVNAEKRYSIAYIGSLYNPRSLESLTELAKIKNGIKSLNNYNKRLGKTNAWGDPLRFRVVLKGREPIEKVINPRTGRENSYNIHGDVVGGIRNAGRVDIYIHERRD